MPSPDNIAVVISPRARRISLTVKASGEVCLICPVGVPPSRALEFLETKREWIAKARERMAGRRKALPLELSAEERKLYVERLRREAKADLPQRVERISAATGLKYEKLTIRAARTKWGSCTSRNNISLSLFLMILPEHLRDFVILHELCHTRHHNHSPRFHALVNKLCAGEEKALSRELRAYAIRG